MTPEEHGGSQTINLDDALSALGWVLPEGDLDSLRAVEGSIEEIVDSIDQTSVPYALDSNGRAGLPDVEFRSIAFAMTAHLGEMIEIQPSVQVDGAQHDDQGGKGYRDETDWYLVDNCLVEVRYQHDLADGEPVDGVAGEMTIFFVDDAHMSQPVRRRHLETLLRARVAHVGLLDARPTVALLIKRIARSQDDFDSDSFNSALADLQDTLGQDDGGVAGAFFSDLDSDSWDQMGFEGRVDILGRYVKTELDYMLSGIVDD